MSELYLLDTNILSELGKKTPDQGVTGFVNTLENAYLSIISVHEIQYGLQLLPEGQRRTYLSQMMENLLHQYADNILPISQDSANQAATLRAVAQQNGRALHLADALIAGTAIANDGLILVTHNAKDFSGLPVAIKNPFN